MLTPVEADPVRGEPGSATPAETPRAALWAIAAGALAVFFALVAWGARGVRGTDQYWYLADLQMVKAGRGMVSNFIGPVVWASPQGFGPDNLPPPVHHIPVTYLAAGVDHFIDDPYLSWVITDGALAVIGAGLLYLVARSIVRPLPAAIAAAVFLLSPQTLWLTLNPLAEQSIVLAAVVLALGTVIALRRPVTGVALMAVAVAFMAVTRATNLALLPVGVLLLGWLAWRRRTSWWLALGFGAGAGTLWWLGSRIFEQYPLYSVKSMVAMGTAADLHRLGPWLPFDTVEVPLTWRDVAGKVLPGLQSALLPESVFGALMGTVAIVLLGVGVAWGARGTRAVALAWWGLGLFGVYLATGALISPQVRYLSPVLPFAIVLAAAALERLGARGQASGPRLGWVLAGGVAAACAGLVLAGIVLTRQYAAQAGEAGRFAAEVGQRLDGLADGGAVLVMEGPRDPAGVAQPLDRLVLSELLVPAPVLGWVATDDQSCFPRQELAQWRVTHVVVPQTWSDERVQNAFCGGPADPAVALRPMQGDAMGVYGLRSLTVG